MTGWLLWCALRVSLWLAAVAMAWHVLRPMSARGRRRLLAAGLAAVPLWVWMPETLALGHWLPVGSSANGSAAAGIVGLDEAGDGVRQAGLALGRGLAHGLVGLWLLGCALLLARTTVRWLRWRRLAAGATPVPPDQQTLTTESPLPVAVLAGLSSPCVTGLLRPRLLVPESALYWSDAEWRAMVRHEWQHVRQGDLWWGWWMEALRIALWWNPLIHGLVNRWREECELCCDAAAVAHGDHGGRRLYARLLLRLVEQPDLPHSPNDVTSMQGAHALPSPTGMMSGARPFHLGGERCLRRRLESILESNQPATGRWQRNGRWLAVVGVLAAGGCGAASGPGNDMEQAEEKPKTEAAQKDEALSPPGVIELADEARIRWVADPFPGGTGE